MNFFGFIGPFLDSLVSSAGSIIPYMLGFVMVCFGVRTLYCMLKGALI